MIKNKVKFLSGIIFAISLLLFMFLTPFIIYQNINENETVKEFKDVKCYDVRGNEIIGEICKEEILSNEGVLFYLFIFLIPITMLISAVIYVNSSMFCGSDYDDTNFYGGEMK